MPSRHVPTEWWGEIAPRSARLSLVEDERVASDGALVKIAWEDVVSELEHRGWASLQGAVSSELVAHLADEDGRQWRLLGDEGVVHQHAFGSYTPLSEARLTVRRLGTELVSGISAIAARRGLPAPPVFNEVTWTRYPERTGQITRHSDPPEYHGVIAIFTLRGSALFRVFDAEGEPTEWSTIPGDLAVLCGARWPFEHARCPLHEVEPPPTGERMIMTFRSNARGAGAGYTV